MPSTMKQVRKLEGERVRLRFQDGREELALLLCATRDMDGSEHLVYELIPQPTEGSPTADTQAHHTSPCLYANARTVLSIESVPGTRVA